MPKKKEQSNPLNAIGAGIGTLGIWGAFAYVCVGLGLAGGTVLWFSFWCALGTLWIWSNI